MFYFIGFVVVFFILLYKRSTEIVVINPMRGAPPAAPVLRDPTDEEMDGPSDAPPDFATLLNTIKTVAVEAANQSAGAPPSELARAQIRRLVENDQIIEAIKLYTRLYKVDLKTAKKAVDQMRRVQ